uniref:RNA-directed RNA polymerase n=1 Tax=Solemoviridae sp. TaxID=2715208 RepID=A0A6M3YPK1_9VIRU|nr:MAG: hypothetical protein 2 [Solemoviridae sp.]
MQQPNADELEYVRAAFDNANHVAPRGPKLPGDPDFNIYFRSLLRTLDPKSSTGLGAFEAYATIGDALGWDGIRFTEVHRVAELQRLVESRLRDLARGVPDIAWFNDRAEEGADIAFQELKRALQGQEEQEAPPADNIKLFIKDEPHKISKVSEKRWRLISAQSLVDQMTDRVLFYSWVETEISDHFNVTSKGGWSPLPMGYQRLMAEFPEDTAVAVDKSLWDWTMPPWVVYEYLQAKARATPDMSDELMWLWARRFWFVLGPGARVRMPTGVVWRQDCWGLMKSGFYLTLSMNGAAQMLQHALAWRRMGKLTFPPRIWTMGDDTLTRLSPSDMEEYRVQLGTTGCIVKMVERAREFAGYKFEGNTIAAAVITPLYERKHQFILKHVDADNERSVALAFSLLYALARPGWHTQACVKAGVTVGPMQRLWARGQVKLDLLEVILIHMRW